MYDGTPPSTSGTQDADSAYTIDDQHAGAHTSVLLVTTAPLSPTLLLAW
jgi:hypothetical protein